MTDDAPSGSPFDLEPEAPTPAPTPTPAPVPTPRAAAPAPTRRRESPRTRKRAETDAVPAPANEGGSKVARVFGVLATPRTYYVLAALMTTAMTFAFFNPTFGGQDLAWFWDSIRTGGTAHAYSWNPTVLQACLLPLLALSFLAAALSRGGPSRGWWVGAWVFVAFVAFQLDREQLQYFVPLVLTGAATGALLRRRHRSLDTRVLVILALALGSFLFMPSVSRATQHRSEYVPEAVGLVKALIHGPTLAEGVEDDESALSARLHVLLYGLPNYVILFLFVLLLLALAGLNRSWMGYTSAIMLLTMLVVMTWVNWDLGSTVTGPPHVDHWTPWYGGAVEAAVAWRARFLPFLPALVGCVIEIGRLRKAR